MNRKLGLLLLSINTILFIIVNINSNLNKASLITSIWSWSVWFYMLNKLLFLLDYLSRYDIKGNRLYIIINYISQFIFFLLFVCVFANQIIKFDGKVMLTSISLCSIIELLTFFKLKETTLLYSSHGNQVDKEEITLFINALITHKRTSLENDKKQRIITKILNIITILIVLFIPVIGAILYDIFSVSDLLFLYIITSAMIFLHLNFIKYRRCNISFLRYSLDMILSIISFIYYIAFYQVLGEGGFARIFLFIFLLAPFLLTSYSIAQLYQMGRE